MVGNKICYVVKVLEFRIFEFQAIWQDRERQRQTKRVFRHHKNVFLTKCMAALQNQERKDLFTKVTAIQVLVILCCRRS